MMAGAGKTILVTGGGGYIGSHCIIELLNEGFDVIAVDNFVNCIKDGSIFIKYNLKKFLNELQLS